MPKPSHRKRSRKPPSRRKWRLGHRLALAFVISLWAATVLVIVVLFDAYGRFSSAWSKYRAQVAIAQNVLEDPICTYDRLLGWKHIPGHAVSMDSAFPGEGVVFQINNNGFRGLIDYSKAKPSGVFRIIAVGDSFTFGNVRTEDTWPAQLEAAVKNTEVINMGANGYGLGQMFLWYRQDGSTFDSDVVICAMVEDDLRRVFLHKWASGHGKPTFDVKNNELEVQNVPVPPRVEPGQKNEHPEDFVMFRKMWFDGHDPERIQFTKYQERVVSGILREFHAVVRETGSRFVVAYLPSLTDIEFDLPCREMLATNCRSLGISFVDFTESIRREAGVNRVSVFRADGHYNVAGNRITAELVHKFLLDQSILPPARISRAREGL